MITEGGSGQKHVRFAEGLQDASYTPSRKPHYSAVRKQWIQRCADGQYGELKNELESWKQLGFDLNTFFKKEGQVLLDWAITHERSMPLKFLFENVDTQLVQALIKTNVDYWTQLFLFTVAEAQRRKSISSAQMKEWNFKGKLLLSIYPEIKDCLEQKVESIINEPLKDSARVVIQQFSEFMDSKNSLQYS